jgi:two-component system sensor histidine kinase PhoQ
LPILAVAALIPEFQADQGAAERLLERGARADESAPGHGIGLAVVRGTCAAYDGHVEIDRAALGGALVRLKFGDQRRGC